MSNYKLKNRYSFIKVLVIEDVPFTKKRIVNDIRTYGYFVITVATGREALSKIALYKPHIITISHNLRDITVNKLLNKIIETISREESKLLLFSDRKKQKVPFIGDFDAIVPIDYEGEELLKALDSFNFKK